MQRTATPCTPVRFRPAPPIFDLHGHRPGGEIGRRNGLKRERAFYFTLLNQKLRVSVVV